MVDSVLGSAFLLEVLDLSAAWAESSPAAPAVVDGHTCLRNIVKNQAPLVQEEMKQDWRLKTLFSAERMLFAVVVLPWIVTALLTGGIWHPVWFA